jgi:hypothetical protein
LPDRQSPIRIQALEDAGLDLEQEDRDRIGVESEPGQGTTFTVELPSGRKRHP